jgi:cytochrome c peroxidase
MTRLPALFLSIVLISGCGGGSSDNSTNTAQLSVTAALGDKIFHDPSLSAAGTLSCATCHDPARGHAGNDNRAVPLGGANSTQPGFRNAPSLRYLKQNPAFFFDAEDTPTGGFNRDGRAASLAEQARRPFLAAHEMANADAADVVDKLRAAPYAEEFRAVFGASVFDDAARAFDSALAALATYQNEDPEFNPFTSKYDYFLKGQAALSDQEIRGLALFFGEDKGNCAACHPGTRNDDGSPPLFTDFTYDNLGVPRNSDILANNDAAYFDLGLCGPDRTDLAGRRELCGAFKVPTLRNVAITAPYFHNGRFQTLKEVVAFYVRRDTNPEEWYPAGAAGVDKFNDLPAELRGNVNTSEKPYDRTLGQAPALNEQEIDDLVAFLQTLTDGYQR